MTMHHTYLTKISNVRIFRPSTRINYRRRGNVATRPKSSIMEENYTISFETIYNAERRTNGKNDINVSFEEFYRVILHYSQWVDDKPIAQKVVLAVPHLTTNEAIRIVECAHSYGSAIVVTLPLDEATICKDSLVRVGLKATMELA